MTASQRSQNTTRPWFEVISQIAEKWLYCHRLVVEVADRGPVFGRCGERFRVGDRPPQGDQRDARPVGEAVAADEAGRRGQQFHQADRRGPEAAGALRIAERRLQHEDGTRRFRPEFAVRTLLGGEDRRRDLRPWDREHRRDRLRRRGKGQQLSHLTSPIVFIR